MSTPERTSFTAEIPCHYLTRVPRSIPPNPLIVVAMHGYGQTPEVMLGLTSVLIGARAVIASIAAPFQFYTALGPNSSVVFNWGTRHDWDAVVSLHHYILDTVTAQLQRRFSVDGGRILLLGFSQPVGLNYRYAGTRTGQVGGVIGVCGGVPKDWEEPKYPNFATPLLHIARSEDEFFPAAVSDAFPARLRHHASDVEYHRLPGRHRFPSKAGHVVDPWLERVFGVPPLTKPA